MEAQFRDDYNDGTLEQLLLCGLPLSVLGLAKSLAHWLTSGLPVVVLSFPLGSMLNLQAGALQALGMSLLLGTLTMSLLGTAIGALTIGLRGSAMLVAMLILPLYIPLLIFGASAVANAALGISAAAELYFLAGLAMLALTLAPWATAAALKIRMS